VINFAQLSALLARMLREGLLRGAEEEGFTMSKVRYVASLADIPPGPEYVLVVYGEKYEETRNAHGFIITVARNASKTISDLTFLTAVHSAKTVAKREGIHTIFACK
jgi:hypothetical protein